MGLLDIKDGIAFFDSKNNNRIYSFKLDSKSKEVVYSDIPLFFLLNVKRIAGSKVEFTRVVEHSIDKNRHVVFNFNYDMPEFEEWVCKGILHLERTTKGYNVPLSVSPELVDSLFSYDTFINYNPYLNEAFRCEYKEEKCEVCQKDNGKVHLDQKGALYVNGEKVLDNCIRCPKCGRELNSPL